MNDSPPQNSKLSFWKRFKFLKTFFSFITLNPFGRQICICILSLIIIISFIFIPVSASYPKAGRLIGVTISMGLLWMTNVIPLAVTALIPVFTFPLLSLGTASQVASVYISDISMMFLGGFVVALSMERWNLHKRISLIVMAICGSKLPLLLFGFMFTSYFLSMWISNTAAALIMTPSAMAVVNHMEGIMGRKNVKLFSLSLFLGIAYSCNIGGVSTIVGTPPNMFFIQQYQKTFPKAKVPTFLEWMLFATPLSFIFLIITFILFFVLFIWKTMRIWNKLKKDEIKSSVSTENLISESKNGMKEERDFKKETIMISGVKILPEEVKNPMKDVEIPEIRITKDDSIEDETEKNSLNVPKPSLQTSESNLSIHSSTSQQFLTEKKSKFTFTVLKEELKKMGRITFEEIIILIVFLILVILWSTRAPILGFPGWAALFQDSFVSDGTTAIFVSFWLFLIPARNPPPNIEKPSPNKTYYIMDWNTMKSFPWDLILLYGGGFALADGYITSGLAKLIAETMQSLQHVPTFILIFIITAAINTLTQITSNTATAQIFLPILASLSHAIKIHPMMLMLPATIACSFAFALPVGTPPNMVVFITKKVTVLQMFVVGTIMNVIGVVLAVLFCYFLTPYILGFDPNTLPV